MDKQIKRRFIVGIAVLIVLAIVYQCWHALLGGGLANFDSDEAIIGLMSRHVLQGRIPTYFYGQNYLGALDTWAIALLLKWWGIEQGVNARNVYLLRLWPVLLYGVFLLLQAVLVWRLFGRRTALLNLFIMAFPGWITTWFIYRANVAYGLMSIIGTTALLIYFKVKRCDRQAPRRIYLLCRMMAFGSLAGLGLWIHPMTLFYFTAIAAVFFLTSDEWNDLHRKWFQSPFTIPLRAVPPIMFATLLVAVIVAAFTSGCTTNQTFYILRPLSLAYVAVVITGVTGVLIWVSKRRSLWLTGIVLLTAGFAVGYLPVWRAWLMFGVAPSFGTLPSCPSGVPQRATLLIEQLLPTVWGLPSHFTLERISPAHLAGSLLITVIIVTACIWFMTRHFRILQSLLLVSPLSKQDAASAATLILFVAPFGLVLLSGNVTDWTHVRYMMPAWQAGAVMVASWLAHLMAENKHNLVALAVVGLWALVIGFGNAFITEDYFERYRTRYAPVSILALEHYLAEHQINAGFGDYWSAYAITYLTSERLTLASINSVDRYPAYTSAGLSQSQQAYVFRRDMLPESLTVASGQSTSALSEWMTTHLPALFPEVATRLNNQVLIERRQIEDWDVWVVGESQDAMYPMTSQSACIEALNITPCATPPQPAAPSRR